jgi:3-deoxy-D-manno-octulosonate 8-phosphate phosphatase (KDO 8-P phosphatase)
MPEASTHIKLLILDVDGVLTNGGLPYEADGNEIKVFHVQDGSAIKRWRAAGGLVAIISGRQSPAIISRAKDLGIAHVEQGVADKLPVFEEICAMTGVDAENAAVIGDDLLDLAPMGRCGYSIAVANAVAEVKRAASYVTRRRGGEGAVAEAIERLLRRNGTWLDVMKRYGLHRRNKTRTAIAE